MSFLEAVRQSPFILSDGGIETRIVYETTISLDPEMGVARLVDDARGVAALEAVYRSYLEVGRRHDVPMQVGTPTFRASPDRLRRAGLVEPGDLGRINSACYRLLAGLRAELGDYGRKVFIEGVVGPKGDAYRPEEAPGTDDAETYHRAQVEALTEAGVDLLYAPTFPAAAEVVGLARAMAGSGLPYVLSPVINARGTLLDGTPLADVIARVDATAAPAYFTVSCVHPSILREALEADERLRGLAGDRLLGLKANASRKSPEELVALHALDSEEPERFAQEMAALFHEYHFRVIGGCCGTDDRHIDALALRLSAG